MQNIFEYKDCITPLKAIPTINIYGVDKVGSNVPKFTIAIPTYNRTSTLSETIESALNQEGFDDYNVIVVDNNPERGDETELLMEKYRNHPKVTYYKNSENVGMAGNWNKCAMLSNADQFILLHDDDIIASNGLHSFSKMIEIIPSTWAVIKPFLQKFSEVGDLIIPQVKRTSLIKMHEINYLLGDAIGAPTCILFNRNKYLGVGGANNDFYPSFDFALSYSLLHHGGVYLSNICLGGYRVGINESLSTKTMDMFFEMKIRKSIEIMKDNYIPHLIRQLILSSIIPIHYYQVKDFYNMPDYTFNFKEYGFDDNIGRKNQFVYSCFENIKRIVGRFSKIKVYDI